MAKHGSGWVGLVHEQHMYWKSTPAAPLEGLLGTLKAVQSSVGFLLCSAGHETVNSVRIWASELASWMWGVQQFLFLGEIVSGCSAVPSPHRCSSEAQLGFSSQLWQPEITKNTECWDSSDQLWILSSLPSQLFFLLAWEKSWVWGERGLIFFPLCF